MSHLRQGGQPNKTRVTSRAKRREATAVDDSRMTAGPPADAIRRINDVHERLRGLAETNPLPDRSGVNGWPRVFGSHGHRWISHPVPQDSLDELSRFLGARLPAKVEELLRVIGSGAGPHYGIFTPEQVREEVQLDRDDCATDQIEPPRSEQPFPITAAHIRDELAPVRPYPSRRTLPGRTSDTAAVC